ncbi:ankyrin repeat domain-containing protein [Schaalia sp. Marseille-Q2122]|uniref:ankyrin repeat domain-containing protein n=1 Tax=Schaalia sp. Marseille-Q2122 TaxID=2736604 RepID=UPI0034C6593C
MATLLERGVDVNYHEPDMVEPYAPTAVLSATRHGQPEVVHFLVEHGADVTIADRTGERPYTAALKVKDVELAEYLRSLEPEEWHNQAEKERELKAFKLPQELVEMVRSEDRRLSFPEEETVTWIEFLDFLNLRPLTIRRKKYLLLCDSFEHYDDMYQVLWHGKTRQLFIWDTEHHELHELGTWEEFLANPGKAVNSIF